jgi:hypothetical protein
MGTFHSLKINLEYYNPRRGATTNVAGIVALVKHGAAFVKDGAEISAADNTGFSFQWIYLAKRVE